MKLLALAIAVMVTLASQPALAAPPTAAPSASPAAKAPPTLAQQVDYLQRHDTAVTTQLNVVAHNYNSFAASVYAPYCKDTQVIQVHLIKPLTAWPAAVWCKGMDLKKPGLMAEGPP